MMCANHVDGSGSRIDRVSFNKIAFVKVQKFVVKKDAIYTTRQNLVSDRSDQLCAAHTTYGLPARIAQGPGLTVIRLNIAET